MKIRQACQSVAAKLLFGLVLVAGLALTISLTSQNVQAAPDWRSFISGIRWQTCPELPDTPEAGRLECGTLSVPLDYNRPLLGDRIKIALTRLKAKNQNQRLGAMLLNPGGPGGSGFDMPLWMAELMPQSVLNRYDLIGFDPRGINYSAPVSCGLTLEESFEIAPPLEQNGNFDDTAEFMHRTADGCGEHSGDQLPYITTANTARDMDRIRQALGENKIAYYGISYGTYLGAVYASLFPNNTSRFVLDSATNSRGDWRELFRSWGLADESRFPDFAQFLIDNEEDYDLGGTQAEVRATFFALLDKVRQNPVSFPDGTVLNDPWFRVYSFAGLYTDSAFADTAEIWRTVKEEPTNVAKIQPLAAKLKSPDSASKWLDWIFGGFPDVPEDNSGSATNAVLCDDWQWSRSVDQYRQELAADTAQYPMFAVLGSNIWPCAFWPNDPIAPPTPITSNGPANNILIVHNQRDPATPYANGVEMRSALGQRARLVTVEQGGHGASYGEQNECSKQTVTDFFVSGAFPANDTTCVAEAPMAARSVESSAEEKRAMQELRKRMW